MPRLGVRGLVRPDYPLRIIAPTSALGPPPKSRPILGPINASPMAHVDLYEVNASIEVPRLMSGVPLVGETRNR